MKKTIIALMAMAVISTGAVQAAQQTNSISKWMNETSKKLEKAENNAYQRAADNKKASEARQAERQKSIDAQKKAIEKRQQENKKALEEQKKAAEQRRLERQKAVEKAKADSKARQEQRQKNYETKKQQWKDLMK